jgi:hypothetical protein
MLVVTERAPPNNSQKEIARRLVDNPFYAVLAEMGVGKSRPLLRAWMWRNLQSVSNGGPPVHLLMIAPKGCYLNWLTFPAPEGLEQEPGELDKWLTPEERASVLECWWQGADAPKYHMKRLEELLRVRTRPRFLTVNVEALNRPGKARDYVMEFAKQGNVLCCIDESTCIDQWESARTMWINDSLRDQVPFRVIMTGLVAPESPMNLFSQYLFLSPRILGSSFHSFRARYAIIEKINFTPMRERTLKNPGRTATVIVGWRSDAVERLAEKIAPFSYRVLAEDVLDLPEKTYSYWDVELTDEQATAYESMRRLALAALPNNQFVTASMAAHQLALLHHITQGHVKTEEGDVIDLPNNRITELLGILSGHAGKAIVWCPYPRALEKITAALRDAYGEASTLTYWGATGHKARTEARIRIQRDDKARFIVSNQSVGGKGGTWTAATLAIYYGNSFDQEDRQQSEFRFWRQGQTQPVHVIDMRARTTIESRQINLLKQKRLTAAALQGDRYREWLQ